MKFDFAIGNPPYQETQEGTSDNPIYNCFMDVAYEIAEKVELITPARFLFDAGKTPKVWNEKMLEDEHLKVEYYEQDSSKVFSNTDIKGGVAVTYRDKSKIFGAIDTFTQYPVLNNILVKVREKMERAISDIVYSPESYKFTNLMYEEHPEILEKTMNVNGKKVPLISKGHERDLTSNIFDKLSQIVFFEDKPTDGKEYVEISGRKEKSRMAYGDNTVTLATFDTIIPDKVFLEVTSITLDQFKFLRDGGDYVEEETGQTKHFDGQLFDSVVFDDSVKEFLALKKKLADYFDEKSVEDIFDYIPPQKTNQIFTPKTMVKKMVDMLEQENPGCFDMPDKTFIDLYMKSGLYITEIVKRLYQSDEMKKRFPENKERLKHIFEKQVYGLAPTEIIYKIATSYILGFDEDTKDIKHNFRQLDALPYAKEGTLEQVLDELYYKEE